MNSPMFMKWIVYKELLDSSIASIDGRLSFQNGTGISTLQDLQCLGLPGQFVVTNGQNGAPQLQQIQTTGGNSIITVAMPANQAQAANATPLTMCEQLVRHL